MDYRSIMCDPNNLYAAYEKSIHSSKWKESSQKASLSFLDLIFDLQKDLYNQTYTSGKEYKFVLHERGKTRPITSLTVRDRMVRHVLCDEIFTPRIRQKIIYDNGASLEGRGLSFSKKRFDVHLRKFCRETDSNQGYILFGDFSKFYDNIRHDRAKQILLDLVDNDEYLTWLLNLIFKRFVIDASYFTDREYNEAKYGVFNRLDYYKRYECNDNAEILHPGRTIEKSINIGDQLSQLIGIYYPHKIDTFVKIVKSEKYYGRYMDDWYIIHQNKNHLHRLAHEVAQVSKTLDLHINQDKTRIVPIYRPFSYLQTTYYVTENGRIRKKINSKRIHAMRVKLRKLSYKINHEHLMYSDIDNMFRSWMGSFYKIMSREQRRNMITLYESLFSCTIRVQQNSLIIERN